MNMFDPPHPGEILKEEYLDPLNITITDCGKALGVTRKTISEIVNCRAGISASMALKLSKAFSTTPEFWIDLQSKYDLFKATGVESIKNVEVLYQPLNTKLTEDGEIDEIVLQQEFQNKYEVKNQLKSLIFDVCINKKRVKKHPYAGPIQKQGKYSIGGC